RSARASRRSPPGTRPASRASWLLGLCIAREEIHEELLRPRVLLARKLVDGVAPHLRIGAAAGDIDQLVGRLGLLAIAERVHDLLAKRAGRDAVVELDEIRNVGVPQDVAERV